MGFSNRFETVAGQANLCTWEELQPGVKQHLYVSLQRYIDIFYTRSSGDVHRKKKTATASAATFLWDEKTSWEACFFFFKYGIFFCFVSFRALCSSFCLCLLVWKLGKKNPATTQPLTASLQPHKPQNSHPYKRQLLLEHNCWHRNDIYNSIKHSTVKALIYSLTSKLDS